jgi:hypothetical protein
MLRNHDFVSGLVVTLLGAWGFVYAQLSFPARVRAYPSFVTGLMCLLGVLLLVRSFRKNYRDKDFGPYVVNIPRFLMSLLATALYFYASTEIGFLLATVIFLPLMAWFAGYREIKLLAFASLGYVAAIYLVFDLGFSRPLPEGIIEKLLP